jgi:hypothetical protein
LYELSLSLSIPYAPTLPPIKPISTSSPTSVASDIPSYSVASEQEFDTSSKPESSGLSVVGTTMLIATLAGVVFVCVAAYMARKLRRKVGFGKGEPVGGMNGDVFTFESALY